jgi:hypothetical protein
VFITYKQVKQFVEKSEPGSTVGNCNSAFHCLIAEAVHKKYPECLEVSVGLPRDIEDTDIEAEVLHGHWEPVTTGDDGHKLYELGQAFDKLGTYYQAVTREEALRLFNA